MNEYNHSEFYDRKWSEADQLDEIPIDDNRSTVIMDLVRRWLPGSSNGRPMRIIDVGCGVGWLSDRLRVFGDVLGVDSSKGALDIGRKKFSSVSFHFVDLLDREDVGKLGVFDVAVSSEVVEHIPDVHKPAFAEQVSRLVRPGGLLIVTVPNRLVWDYYWKIPESVEWKQPVEDWCTPSELKSLMNEHFRCLHLSTYYYDYTNRGIYRYLNSIKLRKLLGVCGLAGLLERYRTSRYGLFIAAAFERRR
jgi:SAM-dependent methyltransferase